MEIEPALPIPVIDVDGLWFDKIETINGVILNQDIVMILSSFDLCLRPIKHMNFQNYSQIQNKILGNSNFWQFELNKDHLHFEFSKKKKQKCGSRSVHCSLNSLISSDIILRMPQLLSVWIFILHKLF